MSLNPESMHSEGDNDSEKLLDKFRIDLFQRISEAPVGNLLTLEYFLVNASENHKLNADYLNKKCASWTHSMGETYEQFFKAVEG